MTCVPLLVITTHGIPNRVSIFLLKKRKMLWLVIFNSGLDSIHFITFLTMTIKNLSYPGDNGKWPKISILHHTKGHGKDKLLNVVRGARWMSSCLWHLSHLWVCNSESSILVGQEHLTLRAFFLKCVLICVFLLVLHDFFSNTFFPISSVKHFSKGLVEPCL